MSARILICAVLLGSALPGAAADRPPPKIDTKRLVNESYSFRKNQEPDMTEDEYALYERVVTMVTAQPEFALKLLETLTGSQQKSPAFEFVLGNVYFSNNRPDLAEQHYRAALKLYPDFTRVWSNLGALLYGQGRYPEAAECLTKTIAAGERDAHLFGLLGFCLEKTGRPTAAEMNYLQALGLEPENPDYLEGLLTIYYDRKQYASAEVLLKQLIRVKPAEQKNWLLYGSILAAQERPVEAIAVLEAGNSLGALDADGLLVLSDLYAKQQFYPEAIGAFRQLQKASPTIGAEHLLGFVQALIAAQQWTAAEQALATLPADLPAATQVVAELTRADLAGAREDTTGAQQHVQQALAIDPLNGRALLALGRLQKEQGDIARAEGSLELAARHPEFTYRASLELADLAVKTHRYARALEFLEKASALERSDILAQYIARVRLLLPDKENNAGRL
jgi:tetratricopeptide (TPR) repeat protein